MRIHAEHARRFLGSRPLDEFLTDELFQAGLIRCIEVIGEAARQVSDGTRRRAPQVHWPLIIGMRNVLAHGYGSVDLERVYSVVKDQLPELIANVGNLISILESEVGWQDDDTGKS